MNYRIGFATCEAIPDLTESERKFSEFVKELGILIEPVIWSKPDYDYGKFDLLVIRSCWDYHLIFNEFSKWINILEEQNVYVLNSVKTVKENLHKFYLGDLQKRGVKILDTVFINKNSAHNLEETLKSQKWNKAVIKPAVSGSGYKTYIVSADNISKGQELLRESLKDSDILLQQFAEEINTAGEWSLVFFNKKYSHSVLKHPKVNEFRVQEEHGGTYKLQVPDNLMIRRAEAILEAVKDDLLYARVDGVVVNGEFRLMELELIEPEIFLLNGEIMKRFADALLEHLIK